MTNQPIDVIILAGGKGTRLQTVVADLPKPMAPVNGRPFLDYQLAQLARAPLIDKVVLALGHLADKVIAHYAASARERRLGFVVEDQPLGTAGAVRHSLQATTRQQVLVMNGDSIFDLDVARVHARHVDAGRDATIALLDVPDAGRFGSVLVEGHAVAAFTEKTNKPTPGTINAGVYLFERRVLEAIAADTYVSMEHEVLPRLVADRQLAAEVFTSDFIDIGLPETYGNAAAFLTRLFGSS